MHRPSDVLDLLLSHILKAKIDFVAHLVAHNLADADPARFGQGFQARGDIDAVAIDVVRVDDDVAEIDADAELDPPRLRNTGIVPSHLALQFGRAAHRIDDAGEFDQEPVSGGLDDAAAMPGDIGVR